MLKLMNQLKKSTTKNQKKFTFMITKKLTLEIFISGQFGLIPVVNKNNVIKKIVTWNDVFRNDI